MLLQRRDDAYHLADRFLASIHKLTPFCMGVTVVSETYSSSVQVGRQNPHSVPIPVFNNDPKKQKYSRVQISNRR